MPNNNSDNETPKQDMTIAEEAGLPENWVPIDSTPIVPSNMAAGTNPFGGGSIPPAMSLQSDTLSTNYKGPGIPGVRLMPIGVSGNPQSNAAIKSVATQVTTEIVNSAIAAIPSTTPVTDGLTHGTTPWETDPTSVIWVDDFKYQSGAIGSFSSSISSNETGWTIFGASAGSFLAENWSGGVFPHLGVMQIINSNTSNDWMSMTPQNQMSNSVSGGKETWPLLDYPGWKMSWVFQFLRGPSSGAGGQIVNNANVFSLAQTSCYVGMCGLGSQAPNNGTGPGRPWVFLGLRYDTDPGTSFAVTAAANASGGTTVYTGTFTGGGTNGLINRFFTIAGFVTNPSNNGRFLCTANSTTTLTLVNASGVSESHAATARTDAISDSTLHLEYVTNPNPQLTNASPRNNSQGQTFDTGVTPTENSWYRLDMVCAAAGVITLALYGGGAQLATWTVTCTTVSNGLTTGNGAIASVANGICNITLPSTYAAGNMLDMYWGIGSKISLASATPAFSGITGSQIFFGGTSGSAGTAIFYTSAGSFVGTSGNAVITGYPAFMPYVSLGNDTSSSPAANTKSLNVDFFSFVWNPALSTAGATLNSGYSRYVTGS
jgi:hypothetical protein